MITLKIGVVEDELIIADNIIRTLADIGYQTTEAAISYGEAIVMLEEEKPDLVLLDINLSGKKDGIDVAGYINEKVNVPFIFLTANSDITTLERAKKVAPHAYLVKPFTREDLFVSIEVAVSNYDAARQAAVGGTTTAGSTKDFVFLRNKQSFTKVLFSDILFVESTDNYITINLANGDRMLHRATITEFADMLPPGFFYRCHRSYIVNTGAIQKIANDEMLVGNHPIPVGKERMKGLLELLGIAE